MVETATSVAGGPGASTPAQDAALLERALFEVKRVIVGQDRMVERMLVCLLARGHCLLEGVPGVAKTLAVETLAAVAGGTFARLQFTPDLVPSDIVGTRIFKPGPERFDIELGPVFANFVLTDEINRAPAKVQSALLEVMSQGQVSIGGTTYPMPRPFLVLATQNPIESEGVYPLPEAQRDRFLMKVVVDYPTGEEEREIVYRMGVEPPTADQVLSPADLLRLQRDGQPRLRAPRAGRLRGPAGAVHPARRREHGMADVAGWVAYGASPRASLGMIAAARGLALMRGRDYVLPQDVLDVAADVLRHRLVLSYDALADGVPAEHVVHRVLQSVPLPQVTPRQRAARRAVRRAGRRLRTGQPGRPRRPGAIAAPGPDRRPGATGALGVTPPPARRALGGADSPIAARTRARPRRRRCCAGSS